MYDINDTLIAEAELDERIAVLRRYRKMLDLQRTRLQDYLELLDTREAAVKRDDLDGLEAYTLREQQVIKGIMDVQVCIEPLAEMYRRVAPEGSADIDELHEKLEHLRQRVLIRNEESRALLKSGMDELRRQISQLRIPRKTNSIYTRAAEPQLLDVRG